MTSNRITSEMLTVMIWASSREYSIAFVRADGEFDIVDRFMAIDDDGANAYAEQYYAGQEWFVLDQNGRNINGGDQS